MSSRAAPTPSRPSLLLRFGWLIPLVGTFVGAGILMITYAFAAIPLPKDVELSSSAQVFDRNGKLIGTYSDEVRRFLIDIDHLPRFVGRAVVAAEDREFYRHNGVSVKGIARAAWANITGGGIEQGGSTITQQYVKNAVLRDTDRTLSRKTKEAVLAIKLERRFSKKAILGFYLNTIYLGRSAYGIEAAARLYFDKHAADLTLPEAAYLASIIPSPESYQPDEHRRLARARRNRVLRVMAAEGYITRRRAARAARRPLGASPGNEGLLETQKAAYFMEWLRKEYLYPRYGECLYTCGLEIHTTLDLDMQRYAEEAVAATLQDPKDPEAAVVSVEPDGAVRALVGGRKAHSVAAARGFNYATSFPGRQAGSSFKPFTLLSAIEQGISPRSYFPGGSPMTIRNPECAGVNGDLWTPENFGGASYGTVTLDYATTSSINTVYAQLVARIGPEVLVDILERFGFDRRGTGQGRPIPDNCSLALGTLDVTPLEMARAYAGFAGRGVLPGITPIRYIEDAEGNCLRSYRAADDLECKEDTGSAPRRVAEQNSVDLLNQTLTHVVQGGTATAADIGRPVAGKTGTTQKNVDAWFAGYTPQLATVVWMGYPAREGPGGMLLVPRMAACGDPRLCRPVNGIEVTGGSLPAQIWAAYMDRATARMPVVGFPVGVDLGQVLNSPEPTPTPTPTPSSTATPTASETPSPTPSESDTPSPSPSETDTPTPTPSETPSPTPTRSESPTPTPSPTPSPSRSRSPSPTPTKEPTPAPSEPEPAPEPDASGSGP